MRLDKYLKVSRIIKRRSVANLACDHKKISVNGTPQKASYNVKIGDVICIETGEKPLKVKVLSLNEHPTKDDAKKMFETI